MLFRSVLKHDGVVEGGTGEIHRQEEEKSDQSEQKSADSNEELSANSIEVVNDDESIERKEGEILD